MGIVEGDTARVGQRLRRLREARGESMAVARVIRERYGVKLDASYLSRMERGKAEIPLRTLFALARYYDVDPRDLVFWEDGVTGDNSFEELFHQPDLKSAIQNLYRRLGKEHLGELLWWYFRIVSRTLDFGREEQNS